jgi:hypothetical protein
MEQGRTLVDIADKKIENEVRQRIAPAKDFFTHLRPKEIEARKAALQAMVRASSGHRTVTEIVEGIGKNPKTEQVKCPACGESVPMILSAIRGTMNDWKTTNW